MSEMRFELTQPHGHYPLKVACLPIPPPGRVSTSDLRFQKKLERKTGLEPATPTLARLCSTNWAISANFFEIWKIFISHLRMQSYCFFLIWPNVFVNIFIYLIIWLIISVFVSAESFQYKPKTLKNHLLYLFYSRFYLYKFVKFYVFIVNLPSS